MPEFAEFCWSSKSRRRTHPDASGRIRTLPDASGRIRDASGRIRNRYQFRRNLHLANTPSFLASGCARPLARPLSATVPLPESAPTPEKVCGKRDRACRARLTEAQRVATAAGASQADQQLGLFEKEYQNAERKEKRKAENGNFENINY